VIGCCHFCWNVVIAFIGFLGVYKAATKLRRSGQSGDTGEVKIRP
jgi:hypothetical protein